MEDAHLKKRSRKIKTRIRPLPVASVPAAYLSRFGRIDPEAARRVAKHVQENAVNRFRFKTVDGALREVAAALFMSRSTGYRVLRAGRWLLWRECSTRAR